MTEEEMQDLADRPPRPFFRALIYERDGSLNLSWVILLIYTALSVCAVVFALRSKHPLAFVAVLSFLAVTINLFALGAVSQNKAKIIANARNIGEAGKAVAGVVGMFGTSTERFDAGMNFDYGGGDRDRARHLPPEVD